ncbi:MAG: fatty acid desaturase [Arenicellales bacterium]|jgi:fatty acid desaturase|nr:fatty acid desaturase [Arenicellales bacterium]
MAERFAPTNAASSSVHVDSKVIRSLRRRRNGPGLVFLLQWGIGLTLSGLLVWLALGSGWIWPAMAIHGGLLTLPAYALSHETAHGTAYRARWLNETVLWFSSILYMEEPLHRRYTHTNHHTYTWHQNLDSQMPFDLPMTLRTWVLEIAGLSLLRYHIVRLVQMTCEQYSPMIRKVVPQDELPRLTRNARIFLLIYIFIGVGIFLGHTWLLWFLVIPRLLGAPIMQFFTILQHAETAVNSPSILDTTRSFHTNWLGRVLYMNMNYHVEHHLYPNAPFFSLPALAREVASQIPEPDPGLWRTNLELVSVALRRSWGKNTRARTIRQAPQMITEGVVTPISKATM